MLKKRRVLEVSEENAELCGFILQRLIMTAMMEDPRSPEFRETRIKVPSRSDVIGRPVNCGGRGWMWGEGAAFSLEAKELDHSDGDSIIKSKFDIIIIRSECVCLCPL